MCTKHEPKELYQKPDAKTQPDLALAYVLRDLSGWIVCGKCGLTGLVTSFGNTRWLTKGTVGYLDREAKAAKAAEWNKLVAGEAEPK